MEERAKRPTLPKFCHTYPTIMKLGTVKSFRIVLIHLVITLIMSAKMAVRIKVF